MTALRSLEREKDIAFDLVVEAIEAALLTAYRHTEGAQPTPASSSTARPARSPSWRRSSTRTARSLREYDDTPADFGRIATMTAKQVILQRLREAEHDD